MPTIVIKETLQKDKEYSVLTDLTDVESSVSAHVLSEVPGPTAISFNDEESGASVMSFSEVSGPSVISYSDIIYNITKTLYVTNINSCEFGFVPFNDTITYEE